MDKNEVNRRYARISAKIREIVRRTVRNRNDWDDIQCLTEQKLYCHYQDLTLLVIEVEKAENFEAFLRQCVKNAAISFWRSEKRHQRKEVLVDLPTEDNVSRQANQQIVKDVLTEAMMKLTAKERAVVGLVVNDGMGWKEAADFLHIKAECAYRRFMRAKEKLRRNLGDDFDFAF